MNDRIKIRSVSDGSAWGWGPMRIKKCLRIAAIGAFSFVPNWHGCGEVPGVFVGDAVQ